MNKYQHIYLANSNARQDYCITSEPMASDAMGVDVDLFACRVCLATDIKLFDIHECDLAESFETVMGLPVPPDDGFPQHLCHYCFSQLQKYATFKEKCKRSLDIMETAVMLSQPLTTDYVRIIDREAEGLALPLVIHDNIIDYEIITDLEPPLLNEAQSSDGVKEELQYEEVDESEIYEDDAQVFEVIEHDYMAQEVKQAVDSVLDVKPVVKKARIQSPVKSDKLKNRVADNSTISIVTLTKEQQVQEMNNRQLAASYVNALHKCDKCFRGFHNGSAYRNHMVLHNPSSGPFECEICEIRFMSEAKMRAHAANVHERRYICKQCNHVSCSSHRALQHQRFHEGKTFDCQICADKFEKSSALLTHMRTDHPDQPVQRKYNQTYKPRGPNSETWITCEECNVDFNGATAFTTHMNTASPHIDDGGHNIFYCTHCGESYDSEESLQDHKMIHVGCNDDKPKSRPWRRAVQPDSEKPYCCESCGKSFKFPQYLQIHIRTHTGERPYVCNICCMAFQAKANLNRHYKVHTGDKPYICDLCGRSFTQSNSMKLHVKTVHLKMPDPYRDRRRFYRNRRKDGEIVETEETDDITVFA